MVTIFHDFKLQETKKVFKNFTCKPEDRTLLLLKRDKAVSGSSPLLSKSIYSGNGAISMDINYDHFALAELDETGKLLDQKLIRFDLMNKSTGTNIWEEE